MEFLISNKEERKMTYKLNEEKLKPQKGFSKDLVGVLGETDIGTKKSIKRAMDLQ